jgi:RimJ/RimL family protein N-acetyltransferase
LIHELTTNKGKLKPLINNFGIHPVLESIIEGFTRGKIFVDNILAPRSGIIWVCPFEGESVFFLLGDSNHTQFNDAFRHYFNTEIKHFAQKNEWDQYWLQPLSNWSEETLKDIFGQKLLVAECVSYYILNPDKFLQLHSDWKKNIPEGYSAQCVESEDIFKQYKERMPEFADLTAWSSYAHFKERGLAYCLSKDKTTEIVAGCSTGYVVNGKDPRCELGVATDEQYRRNGFATLVSCAMIEEALNRNLKVIVEIWSINKASLKTHQKLGFDHQTDKKTYACMFDELLHYLTMSYSLYLHHNKSQDSIQAFNKALEIQARTGQNISSVYYYNAACAYAKLNNIESTVRSLLGAIESGLQDPKRFSELLQSKDVFSELRKTEIFNEIIKKVQN